jgi:putative membrane protein
MADPGPQTGKRSRMSPRRRERLRLLGAVIAAVLVTVFAVVNLDRVKVDWIIGTWSTPLIVVIAVSAAFGAALDRLLQLRRRRRTKRPPA